MKFKILFFALLFISSYSHCLSQNEFGILNDGYHWDYRISKSMKGKIKKIETYKINNNDTTEKEIIHYDTSGRATNLEVHNYTITLSYINNYLIISYSNIDSKHIVFFDELGRIKKQYSDVEGFSFGSDTILSGEILTETIYHYDNQGRPIRITEYDSIGKDGLIYDQKFSYDTLAKVINSTMELNDIGGNRSIKYNYDSKNRITKIREVYPNNLQSVLYFYTYNNSALMSHSSMIYFKTTKFKKFHFFVFKDFEYQYDVHGNWITKKVYRHEQFKREPSNRSYEYYSRQIEYY